MSEHCEITDIDELLTQYCITYYDIFQLKIIDKLLEKYVPLDRDNIIANISKRLAKFVSHIHNDTDEISDMDVANKKLIKDRLIIMIYLVFNKIYYSNSKEQYNYVQNDNDEFVDSKHHTEKQCEVVRYSESLSSIGIETIYKSRRFFHIFEYVNWIISALQVTDEECVCVSILLCRLYEIDDDIISTFLKGYVDMLVPIMIMISRKMYTQENSVANGQYSRVLHFELDKLNELEVIILTSINIYISQDEYEIYALVT